MSQKLTLEEIKEKILTLSPEELEELSKKLEPVFNSTKDNKEE